MEKEERLKTLINNKLNRSRIEKLTGVSQMKKCEKNSWETAIARTLKLFKRPPSVKG